MKKIIVGITGSSGVFATNFINLFSKKYKFINFDGDITKKKEVFKWVKENKFNYIIHAAAKSSIKYVNNNYRLSYKVNVDGTKNLVTAINFYSNVKYFFFLSSAQVYNYSEEAISEYNLAKPISKYGYTKLYAEKIIKKFLKKNIRYCIARIFSYTDVRQSKDFFVPAIFNRIKKSKFLFKTENLFQKRDFIHIYDLCTSIDFLITKKFKGTINIGSGKAVELNYVVKYFCKKFKKKLKINKTNFKFFHLYPNIKKLKKIGYSPKYKINDILSQFK
jgi:nucleoside-diphosphate-sugar epimerase